MWIIPKENGQGLAFFVVVVIVAILAVFAFTVRVCSRRLHKASLDMSDYACLIGLVSTSHCSTTAAHMAK
jgi:uncharacterized membrane protein YhaH (DUF805 family)